MSINAKLKKTFLHLLFWFVVWRFFSYYFSFNSDNESYIQWFSNILMPITIANTYISINYLIPNFLITRKHIQFTLYSFYVFVGSAYLLSITMFVGYVFMSELDFKQIPPLSASLPFIMISMYLVVILVSAFSLVQSNFQALEKNKELETEFLQAQLQLKVEELKFLRMQIHPHFLFNTLNTIYGFALKKSAEAPNMVLKLSNLLDYILYQIEKPKVLLSAEINHIQDYIELEKTRFNDTLNIDFRNTVADNQIEVAPMLLIPFIENSFKHGNLIDGVLNISISIATMGNDLIFTVNNSSTTNCTSNKGIGLDNIKKRLKHLYPEKHALSILTKENEFSIELKMTIYE